MSISSEIARLSSNVSAAKAAIAAKGVPVPSTATSNDLADLISLISTQQSDIFLVELSWDGTTGAANKTYDQIKAVVFLWQQTMPLGTFMLGESTIGYPSLVYGVATIQNETSVYNRNVFPCALYRMDDTNKKAWFLVKPSLALSVDENGAVAASTELT